MPTQDAPIIIPLTMSMN